MARKQAWTCEDCDWTWPLAGKPPAGSECDNCGGELVPTDEGRGVPTMTNAPATTVEYEVIWPDGDIYANRHGETRLAVAEACATAQAIGGTWRPATTPATGRLYFYKLTCGHEMAMRSARECGTSHDCREGGRLHLGAVIRLVRVRDSAKAA
jgi:hypothetical protein